MKEYHKIQSVYLRDPATKHKNFLEGQWSEPSFGYLAGLRWTWTEKVDGTNIRVCWNGDALAFRGKSDEAQIPPHLQRALEARFTPEVMRATFPHWLPESGWITLYGEGYGAKIQKGGGNYLPDRCDFILFDAHGAGMWLERHNVEDIAGKLNCPVVPVVGRGPLEAAIEATKTGMPSVLAPGCLMEGLVMRPEVELLDRRGHRVITKAKHKDFKP